ncbi:arsenite efflux transporter ATPase subunit ArsA [Alpinimonas psychrophila]|uniref:Arsenite-transporting ATPase n=1 Tax=Alpinimonas psychrophila TaxID=748908 RepID=A0A7W3JT26_9MICO|nr:arsenical pump-driving ATPase [Alpinimonas psychrophila]MBA8828728.1 arsenite-transporting ATPase [Alpinimonas psychrophila]
MTTLAFLDTPPRFLFFTGKGGVGKTSVACATAIRLAHAGQRVLLVSTDPASNVGQVLGIHIGNTITPIPHVVGLSALEIDPEQAAAAYRERIIAPVRDLLPAVEITLMTEQLSGSCTTEIASFNEFTDLLATPELTAAYDHVIFDTAPTGHTIRLLQLPGSWTDFLNEGKGDASCLGPLSGLEKQRATYARAVDALKDPAITRLVLVSRAQKSSLAEAARTLSELATIDIACTNLVINGVLPASVGAKPGASEDELTTAIRTRESAAIAQMPAALAAITTDIIDLKIANMMGVEALVGLLADEQAVEHEEGVGGAPWVLGVMEAPHAPLRAIIDQLEADEHGLVLCMGKGGVGKTTVAAAIAVALAHRGHDVTLTTTDPAAHLSETLQGEVPSLTVTRIDPESATQIYRDRVMKSKGSKLDDIGKAALWEDLQSPCTEEVAVFQQFSRAVHESQNKFVIVDTAPTGHTLLLLDAAGSYHREVARQMGDSIAYITPLMRLQDPVATKVVIVTLAEPTPVMEAAELQDDLKRAGIAPYAWVVNNSLAAAGPSSPFLRQRAANELPQIARVEELAPRVAVIPLLAEEPIGEARLTALGR